MKVNATITTLICMNSSITININNRKLIKLSDIVLDKGTDRKRFIQFKFKKLKTSIKKNKIYTWQSIGSEYRASEISSALVYEQIKRKNLKQNKRKKVWNKYISAFNDLNKNCFVKAVVLKVLILYRG